MIWYRALITVLSPVVALWLMFRLVLRREQPSDIWERLGRPVLDLPSSIWIHGASNGELTSARPLIEALKRAFPEISLVVTANTTTGRDLVIGWAMTNVYAALAPLDFRACLAGFRRRASPAAMLVLENEIWPNRIATAKGPVIVVAARVSDKAARNWRRFPGLAKGVAIRLDLVLPQNSESTERLTTFGMSPDGIGATINLKSLVSLPDPDAGELKRLSAVFRHDDTILAGSTHEGEDEIILAAYQSALNRRPALKLILAPRHPRRGDAIARMLDKSGLNWIRRSEMSELNADVQVLLADTLGEMPLWYSLASATFVAGSLTPNGGHTPFEPMKFRSAVLVGPNVENFEDVYAKLVASGAAQMVKNETELCTAMVEMGDEARRRGMVIAAERMAQQLGSDDGIEQVIEYLKEKI